MPISYSLVRLLLVVLLFSTADAASATFGGGATDSFAYHDIDPRLTDPSRQQYAIFVHPTGQISFPPLGPTDVHHRQPEFSPDGQKIVFVEATAGVNNACCVATRIEVMDANGQNTALLVDDLALAQAVSAMGYTNFPTPELSDPAWTADGQRVVFVVKVRTAYDAGGLWSIKADGTGLERWIANPSPSEQLIFAPDSAPYGRRIAFQCRFRVAPNLFGRLEDLCVFDAANGSLQLLPIEWPHYFTQSMGSNGPEWTPDGSRVLFGLHYGSLTPINGAVQSEIFSIRPDGTGIRELTHSHHIRNEFNQWGPYLALYRPAMSPDGASIIAFGSEWGVGTGGYSLAANGGGGVGQKFDLAPSWASASNYGATLRLDWKPGANGLTIRIDDGHDHPLSRLQVELRTPAGVVVEANPNELGAGRYGFTAVAPGDYVVYAKLMDDVAAPIFGVFHAPDQDGEAVWIEKDVVVGPASTQQLKVAFAQSDELVDTNVALEHRDRLDDLAFLQFRIQQYVDWIQANVTETTGRPVAFNAFFEADLGNGPYAPDGASYFAVSSEDLAIILLGSTFSEYENRDGIRDPAHDDEAPMNGEWHEFTHHLLNELVDASVCPVVNHGGYSNASTCDSLNEGFAAFLPTLAARTIEGSDGAIYAGRFDLEGGGFKAWSAGTNSSGIQAHYEDVAVASLFWDLVDSEIDRYDTQIVDEDGVHRAATFLDLGSMSLQELWLKLTTLKPHDVRELRLALGSPALDYDIDSDSRKDVAWIDQLFIMQGFFPVDVEQNTPNHPYHYDVGRAQHVNPLLPRNDAVGFTDHVYTDGIVTNTYIPRTRTPSASGAALDIQVRDASGTPLSGATVELTIQPPAPPPPWTVPARTSTHELESGVATKIPLELRPYYDFYLPIGAPLPPCPPSSSDRTTVTLRVTLNGYTAASTPSFDDCAYQQAVAAATGPTAMAFTLTFPEDSTPPTTSVWKQASETPVGNGTPGFWILELDCQDPETGGFASGCRESEYRIDGGALQRGRGPIRIDAVGSHMIEYRSLDAAGNEEPFRTQVVGVGVDPDSDGDGLTDGVEIGLGTNYENADTDGDGLVDGGEVAAQTSPFDPDSDDDQLDDGDEIALGTDPLSIDTDGDSLFDGVEVHFLGTNPLAGDTDGDGLGDELELRTSPTAFDTDGDGRSDRVELASGTDALVADLDSDDDGAPDLTDNCLRLANPAQLDRDDDHAGDACDLEDTYSTWQLVGVTSDFAETPESLFAIDRGDASTTFLMSLGDGDFGDAIVFHPGEGLLYYASGSADRIWERVDLANQVIDAPRPFCCRPVAMAFDSSIGGFLFSDWSGEEFEIKQVMPSGDASLVGGHYDWPSGLAFVDGAFYAGSAASNWIYNLAPATAERLGRIGATVDGIPIESTTALARDPATGGLFGIFSHSGQQILGRLDLATGAITAVGPVSSDIVSIAFVPEPSLASTIAAGVLFASLAARRRSRRTSRP